MKLDIDDVMAEADYIYSQMRDQEGRPQSFKYGIESSQVKALAEAIVNQINVLLSEIETKVY